MGEGKSNGGGNGGNVFVLLSILVLIVGIVAAAGMVMAVLNYNRGSDTPININVEGGPGGPGGSYNPGDAAQGPCIDCGRREPPVVDLHYDTRVWTIQASRGNSKILYIDRRTRTLKGHVSDIVNAVCQIAGKNCELIDAEWPSCWNNGFPQEGLLGRWYDACSFWGVSLDRLRSYKFSLAFTQVVGPVLITLPGNPVNFDPDNLGSAKIGFLQGWWADRFCLLYSSEYDIRDDQISEYFDGPELMQALNNREIDAAFVSGGIPFVSDGSVYVARELPPCLQDGSGMMMRKDSLFKDWWDPAFTKLINSRMYREICNDIDDPAVHGNIPGGPAEDICVGL